MQPPNWERCVPLLEAAMHRGGDVLTLDDVRARILDGQYQLWQGPDSAIVTQLIAGAKERELNILLAGGSLDTLEDMLPALERFAQLNGCAVMTILGRLGWMRSFLTREHGYRPVAVLLGKRLEEAGAKDE